MKKNLTIGELHRVLNGHPNHEHEYFHEFLLFSPSYRLAHQFLTGQDVDRIQCQAIFEWDLVLKTYSLCGDVYSMPFLKWWDSKGRGIFYSKNSDGSYEFEGHISLLNNKINRSTLHSCLSLVSDKARLEKRDKERIENWRLGVEVKFPSKWSKVLTSNAKKTHDNLGARSELGSLVSKRLKEALFVAENAARGRFPSITSIYTGLKFNYPELYELERINLLLGLDDISQRKINKEYVPKRHHHKKVRSKLKKEKLIQAELERNLKLRT